MAWLWSKKKKQALILYFNVTLPMTMSRLSFSETTHNHSAIGGPGIPRYITHIQAHTYGRGHGEPNLKSRMSFVLFVHQLTLGFQDEWRPAFLLTTLFNETQFCNLLGHHHRVNEWSAIVSYTQSMAHGPGASAPPGTLLEMPNLGPAPNLLDQNLHLNQIFRWLVWTFHLRSIAVYNILVKVLARNRCQPQVEQKESCNEGTS